GLEAPGARRNVERATRELGLAVLGGEKAGEGLPDDLLGRIALEPRGAGIPAGDPSIKIDHVDRIVDDRVDEQLEPPAVLLQSLLLRRHLRSRWRAISVNDMRGF